ncbi:hypothetical protein [Streptomyces sp. NBC_01304]|uniref:hypothetical protein n=1 Tax=Streptomyces sp. NBC_01304 TaxID=2903818 RepID=UPI002E0E2157|nr:hypothetical protein OG430_28155 [Streptomyces sp. NBC_01304]
MKMRHVRYIAVVATVVVALTGARRGHGGGCDDDNGSSSSSSSGGFTSGGSSSSSGGSDDDYEVSTGGYSSGTSGSSADGTKTEGESDVKITACEVSSTSETFGEVKFKYEITNGNSVKEADYSGTFEFKETAGTATSMGLFTQSDVAAGAKVTGEVTGMVSDDNMSALSGQCTVKSVSKLDF